VAACTWRSANLFAVPKTEYIYQAPTGNQITCQKIVTNSSMLIIEEPVMVVKHHSRHRIVAIFR
jgi:hypothetical protein